LERVQPIDPLRKAGIPADRILEAAENWIAKNDISGNQFGKGTDRRDWQDQA